VWLTLGDLLALHTQVIEETGGCDGMLKPEALESALQRPLTSFGGVEPFPRLFDKVAALAHSIATTHPFLDGNKRTAFTAAGFVLERHGFTIHADDDEAIEVMLALAQRELSLEQFAAWLETNAVPLDENSAAEE
jgi:death-on-curing protein